MTRLSRDDKYEIAIPRGHIALRSPWLVNHAKDDEKVPGSRGCRNKKTASQAVSFVPVLSAVEAGASALWPEPLPPELSALSVL